MIIRRFLAALIQDILDCYLLWERYIMIPLADLRDWLYPEAYDIDEHVIDHD